ncbi:hypothetical protein [Pseudomonas sp. MPR-ANB1]|uniref:hypothetical protein n=1 Tax=Pseudomonas sp. MPR-ANB1 TaxID=2070628 RepID=UPI0026BD8822
MGRYHLTGTWIDREGCPQTLYNADIQLAPLDTAVIDGRHIPTRWSLKIWAVSWGYWALGSRGGPFFSTRISP